MALPVTDDFTRADADPLDGNWDVLGAVPLRLVGGSIFANTLSGVGGAYWTADTQPANCYMEVTLSTETSGAVYIFIRANNITANGYAAVIESSTLTYGIYKFVYGEAQPTILTTDSITSGTTFKVSANGSTINCYIDGAFVNSAIDTTYTSGDKYMVIIAGELGITSVTMGGYNGTEILLNQYSFRFYNDDGSESSSTPIAGENININRQSGNIFRLRSLIDLTGSGVDGLYKIQYRRKPSGGSFGDWSDIV